MTVEHKDALSFVRGIQGDVDLVCIDPPYFGIVTEEWDNQWSSSSEYVSWICNIIYNIRISKTGSLILFQAIGRHGHHPIFDLVSQLEKTGFQYRNWITWGKRRAYGKKNDYLFTREEILWFTISDEYTFNIPLLDVKRGYDGWNKDYPAKSEYKRVTNVWSDIPEIMRPSRYCEKPVELMKRLVSTHSNPGDLVLDCFAGTGATEKACLDTGRRFVGCDTDLKVCK